MILFDYKEFGGNKNASITEFFNAEPYPEKAAVLNYLKTAGEAKCTCGLVKDCITGEIHGTSLLYRDKNNNSWLTDIVFYVEKYNYMPPAEFIQYVLEQTK